MKHNYIFTAAPMLIWQSLTPFEAKLIVTLINMSDRMADEDGWFWHSWENLIEESALPNSTLRRAVRSLKAKHFIETRIGSHNNNRMTFYRVNFSKFGQANDRTGHNEMTGQVTQNKMELSKNEYMLSYNKSDSDGSKVRKRPVESTSGHPDHGDENKSFVDENFILSTKEHSYKRIGPTRTRARENGIIDIATLMANTPFEYIPVDVKHGLYIGRNEGLGITEDEKAEEIAGRISDIADTIGYDATLDEVTTAIKDVNAYLIGKIQYLKRMNADNLSLITDEVMSLSLRCKDRTDALTSLVHKFNAGRKPA